MQSIRGKKENRKSNELQLQKGAGRGWWKCGNSCLCHHYRLVSPPCIWIIWTFRFCFSSHCSRASVLFRLIHGFGHKDNINNNRNNRCVFICTLSQTIFFPHSYGSLHFDSVSQSNELREKVFHGSSFVLLSLFPLKYCCIYLLALKYFIDFCQHRHVHVAGDD